MSLTLVEQVAIIAACSSFLMTILIILVCKLSTRCWLNKHCPVRPDNEQEYKISSDAVKVKHYKSTGTHHVTLTHPQVERWRHATGDSTSSDGEEGYRADVDKAGVVPDGKPSPDVHGSSSDSPTQSDSGSDLSGSCLIKGEIIFSVFYPEKSGDEEEDVEKQDQQQELHVWIRKVENLIIRRRNRVKVCIKVQILKKESNIDRLLKFFQFLDEEEQEGNIQFEKQTSLKPIHKSLDWPEPLRLPLAKDQIQDRCIRLVCCLHDHLSHYTQIGQVMFSLNDVILSEEVAIRRSLTPVRQGSRGELLVTLCYLPTAEKLVVTPAETKQLKLDETKYPSTVHIKVSLVSRGSYVKYKSRYQDSHPRIVWTDTMTFDLPKDQLPDVNLVFTVKQTITLPETKKVVVVGRLVIGAQNCSQKGQQQWNKMLLNPREAQAEWHTLI